MQKADILDAISRGAEPYAKNGSFILETRGQGGVVCRTLVNAGGVAALGRFWAETTGRQLPENGFRMDQPLSQRGASEYISYFSGKEHQARKWNGREYTYTRIGRTYSDANPAKWIVEVLVII